MSLGKADWAAIKEAWQAGAEPAGRIAGRFGTTHQQISARARRERWTRATWCADQGERAEQAEKLEQAEKAEPAEHGGAGTAGDAGEGGGPAHGTAGAESLSAAPASPKRDRRKARRAIVERLFDAMDTKLSALEARIAAGGDATPADSERTTRALNTLVRSLEKLADYEGKISKGKRRKNGERRAAPADAEHRREKLARRIERLLERR